MTLNLSAAVFLVNKKIRAMGLSYEVDAEGKGKQPYYIFKTVDPNLAVGDYVTVPTDTRHGFTICRIEETDVDFDHLLEGVTSVKWIVNRVDTDAYKHYLEQEAEMIKAIQSAERQSKREELAKKLLRNNPNLAGMELASDVPALPPPAAPTISGDDLVEGNISF